MPTLSVLILNWNGHEDTSLLLRDFQEQWRPGMDLELLVLDNGSTTKVPAWWAELPFVTVVQSGRNLGYSGGMTTLIARSAGLQCWLVNNDCRLGSGALEAALDVAKDNLSGVSLPLVRNPDGSVQSRDCYWHPILGWRTPSVPSHETQRRQIFGDIFVAPLFPKVLASELGLFPPAFHTYGEDFDAAYAIGKAGYRIQRRPTLVLFHRKSSSRPPAGPNEYHFTLQGGRNVLVSVYLNYATGNLLWAGPLLLIKVWIYDLLVKQRRLLRSNPSLVGDWIKVPARAALLGKELGEVRRRRKSRKKRSDVSLWCIGATSNSYRPTIKLRNRSYR